jgi:hypothetical protein
MHLLGVSNSMEIKWLTRIHLLGVSNSMEIKWLTKNALIGCFKLNGDQMVN